MALRISSSDVEDILTETTLSNLHPFMIAANSLVDGELLGKGLSEDRLKEIERWLSAHFAAVADPQIQEESLPEGMRFKYETAKIGMYLEATRYGQMAVMLDTSRTLARASGSKAASFRVD